MTKDAGMSTTDFVCISYRLLPSIVIARHGVKCTIVKYEGGSADCGMEVGSKEIVEEMLVSACSLKTGALCSVPCGNDMGRERGIR